MFSKTNKKGDLRFLKVVYRKGDKFVKEERELQVWNDYWQSVPTATITRTWDEENEFYRNDDAIDY